MVTTACTNIAATVTSLNKLPPERRPAYQREHDRLPAVDQGLQGQQDYKERQVKEAKKLAGMDDDAYAVQRCCRLVLRKETGSARVECLG